MSPQAVIGRDSHTAERKKGRCVFAEDQRMSFLFGAAPILAAATLLGERLILKQQR